MKFLITRTSKYGCYGIKDFKTIEDLIDFKKTVQDEIIITDNGYYHTNYRISDIKGLEDINDIYRIPYEIEIYDDYRE